MISKRMDFGSKDLFSSLPDALVCHILSFLSTKDAALTSVLSKRWRYLLAFVPILDFDSSVYKHTRRGTKKSYFMRKSFKAFVDRVLALQGNAPLNKFSLKCKIGCDEACVDGWIHKVLDRGVLHLDLYLTAEYDYTLPSKVFMCKTLVSLKVGGGKEESTVIDVKEVSLPKLKSLYFLDKVEFEETGAAFSKLISACPVLEELVMVEVMWCYWKSCSVSNPTLKRVTIYSVSTDENPKSVSFDTPNLVYLEFADTVAVKYPKTNFGSLFEASVGLRMTPSQVFRARDLVNFHHGYKLCKKLAHTVDFLVGINNIKILYLSSEALEVLTFCCKTIPVFNNLVHLTIETDEDVDWESMPKLLENCPNLETLVFEGLHYGDPNQCDDNERFFQDKSKCYEEVDSCMCKPWRGTPSWLSSSPVKMLKVLKYGEISTRKDDIDRQTELIKYFLETMPNLEEVILYYDTQFDDDVSIVSTEFQMLEKVASTKCKIQVISDNISFSSTVPSSSSANERVFSKNVFPSCFISESLDC